MKYGHIWLLKFKRILKLEVEFLSPALKNPDICSAGSKLWEGFLSWFPTQKNIFTVQTFWGRHPWKSTGTLPRVLRGAESVPMCVNTQQYFFFFPLAVKKPTITTGWNLVLNTQTWGPLYHRSLQRCPSLTPRQLPAEGLWNADFNQKNFPFKSSLQFTHRAKKKSASRHWNFQDAMPSQILQAQLAHKTAISWPTLEAVIGLLYSASHPWWSPLMASVL